MFKIILLGEVGVGKSSLFLRIKENDFGENLQPTLGIETCSREVHADGRQINLGFWDTAGVERFKTVTRNYYKNAHAVFLVFSCNDPVTLYYLSSWTQDTNRFAPSALKFLIGNKSDLERLVSKENVANFCEVFGCSGVFYVSAKTGDGISEIIKKVSEMFVHQYRTSLTVESQYSSSIILTKRQKNEGKWCC